MVCSPDDLVVWKDFPKGLRILLLEHDKPSAAETKLKLEAMDYIVSLFCNEGYALEAISKKTESFHVAIIEVTSESSSHSYRFLEMARDLPTIVMSNVQCLSTMMKCIALGAAEFLQKPISEDKLRNIWQHVVHKAFNAGGSVLTKSLKPIKETVVSMLQLQSDTAQLRIDNASEAKVKNEENEHSDSLANDKFLEPSTPWLAHGVRLLDDGDCHDQPDCSAKKEITENANDPFRAKNSMCSESKSADNTSNNLISSVTNKEVSSSVNEEPVTEEEIDSAGGSKTYECGAVERDSIPLDMDMKENSDSCADDPKKKTSVPCSSSYSNENRGNRKKMKVDWTPETKAWCSESKSADNTSNNLIGSVTNKEVSSSVNGEPVAEEEVDSDGGSKTHECGAVERDSIPLDMNKQETSDSCAEDSKKKTSAPCSSSFLNGNRGNRKKMKVDWTPELHRRFVQAVEQLGVDQAIPSKILELMKVEGLTRHNVASHLQKYRMHRRHILPKDDDRRWQLQRDSLLRGYMQKPPVAIPSYHSNYSFPPRQVYPIWGHQSYHPSGIQMWGHASYPTWLQPPENWLWKTYPVIGADAWGCPVIPPYSQFPIPSQSISVSSGVDVIEDRERVSKDSYDHLAEEVIDEAVKEAMSKPWLPLPLGLKPPSTDSVLSELHHQGIHTVPPPHCSSRQ